MSKAAYVPASHAAHEPGDVALSPVSLGVTPSTWFPQLVVGGGVGADVGAGVGVAVWHVAPEKGMPVQLQLKVLLLKFSVQLPPFWQGAVSHHGSGHPTVRPQPLSASVALIESVLRSYVALFHKPGILSAYQCHQLSDSSALSSSTVLCGTLSELAPSMTTTIAARIA